MANPSSTYLLEPNVKFNTWGRSTSRKTKSDSCMRRDPSAFEYALSIKESASPKLSSTVITKKKEKLSVRRTQSSMSTSYVESLPQSLRLFIQRIKDVAADGNRRFRCVASLLGMGEDNCVQIRMDLSNELQRYHDYYALVYGGGDRVGDLSYALSFFDANPSFDHWMTMSDMDYLIALFYKTVLIRISLQQYLTFLSLRFLPIPLVSRKMITIGFVNENRFV